MIRHCLYSYKTPLTFPREKVAKGIHFCIVLEQVYSSVSFRRQTVIDLSGCHGLKRRQTTNI